MQVKAVLRNLRMSPRKVRLVIGLVRGATVPSAVYQLQFCNKNAAEPVLKLLKSAMANAEHNFQVDPSTLRVAKIVADGGPVLKRSRARAHGRAAPIRKRTSHITLILSDETPAQIHAMQGKKQEKKNEKSNKPKVETVKKEEKAAAPKKRTAKKIKTNPKAN